MTREEFMILIHWDWIILIFGIVNVGAQIPQTIKMVRNRSSRGLSVVMICIYLSTQIAFSMNGYFMHNPIQAWTLWLSAVVSVLNIFLYFKYRP